MNFDEFLIRISKGKNIPLPAQVSQFKMAPPFRLELLEKNKEAIKFAKKAGVLALFYPDIYQQTNLVLILRKSYEGVHSAQVGFPGGKLEPNDDSLEHAALRETFEEIGVPVDDIEVLSPLTEVYIPPSNFYVQPYLVEWVKDKWGKKLWDQEPEHRRVLDSKINSKMVNTLSLRLRQMKKAVGEKNWINAEVIGKTGSDRKSTRLNSSHT